MLALMGGVAGLFIAWWSTGVLVSSMARLAPIDLVYSATPDLRVLAATFGFCLLSTLLFGFMPAWNLSRPDLVTDLKDGEGKGSGGTRLFSRGNVLVMGQICLSLTLLTAAGLFTRSALRAADMAPGFRIANSIVVELDPSLAGYNQIRGRETYRAPAGPPEGVARRGVGVACRHRSLRHDLQRAQHPAGGQRSGRQGKPGGLPIQYRRRELLSDDGNRGAARPNLPGGGRCRAERSSAGPPGGRAPLAATGMRSANTSSWARTRRAKPREMEVVGIVANVQEHVVGEGRHAPRLLPVRRGISVGHAHPPQGGLRIRHARIACAARSARSMRRCRCWR